jgi:hypothetical protein
MLTAHEPQAEQSAVEMTPKAMLTKDLYEVLPSEDEEHDQDFAQDLEEEADVSLI